MRRLVRFYEDIQPIRSDRPSFNFTDITNLNESIWTDYRLQISKDELINWLFPSENDTTTKLNKGAIYKFRTNIMLRKKVFKATLRIMSLYGYTITMDGENVRQIKPILREQSGITIGLLNEENYKDITRILQFLSLIRMNKLCMLFFLMLCDAMQHNPEFKHKVNQTNVLKKWIETQPYLEDKKYKVEEAILGESLEDWEKSYESSTSKRLDAWDD